MAAALDWSRQTAAAIWRRDRCPASPRPKVTAAHSAQAQRHDVGPPGQMGKPFLGRGSGERSTSQCSPNKTFIQHSRKKKNHIYFRVGGSVFFAGETMTHPFGDFATARALRVPGSPVRRGSRGRRARGEGSGSRLHDRHVEPPRFILNVAPVQCSLGGN